MMIIDGVEMVDVQEASRLAHRTPETIRRWVWSGRVRSVKQANRLLVPRADLADLAEFAQPGTAPDDTSGSLSLRQWAELVGTRNTGTPGATARDLILEARAERAGR